MRSGAGPAPVHAHELAHLEALVARAIEGVGGFVVLQGEHGAGLTDLLDEVGRLAAARGMHVRRGRGERDARPFGALLDALGEDPALAGVAFPAWNAGPVLADRAFAATGAIAEVVEQRCESAPVALLIDDLDRADGGSLRVLRVLAGAVPTLPLLVVAAEHLAPGTPGLLDHVGETVVVGTSGVAADPDDGDSDRGGATRRLSGLPAPSLRVLRVASILGRSCRADDIAAIASSSPAEIAAAIADAASRGIVVHDDGVITWRSAGVCEHVHSDIPRALRAALHDRAAAVLAGRGAAAREVAPHLLAGVGSSGIDAPSWLRRAASEIWTADPQRAVEYLRRAVDLAGPLSPLRDELLRDLLDPLLWTNQLVAAETVARELLARARAAGERSHASIGLALALQHLGRHAEAARLWDDLGDDAVLSDPDRAAIVLAELGYAALVRGDLDDLRTRADTAAAYGKSLGHAGFECTAGTMRTLVALAEGRSGDAVEHGERAVASGGDKWIGTPSASVALALARIDADRLDEVEPALRHGRELAERMGSATHVPALQWASVGHAFCAGRWDDALARVDDGLAIADEIGAASGRALALAIRSVISLHRGDLDTADAAATEAERSVVTHGPQLGIDWTMWARGLLHEARGDLEHASALLHSAWNVLEPLRFMLSYRVFAPDVVRVALLHGDTVTAGRVVDVVVDGAQRNGLPSGRALALRCRALLEQSPSLADEAAAMVRDVPRVFDRAATYADAAVLLARDGDIDRAARLADDAFTELAALRAARLADRLLADLRVFGIQRSGLSIAESRPRDHAWHALTDAEAKVADLVAQGLTNREVAARLFLSRHTIDAHLRHVFAKLGISSRVELARLADAEP